MILVNLVLTSMLTCLIWLIQILHYPSFRYVSHEAFTSFEAFHTRSISYIVMPLMLAELGTSIYLFVFNPKSYLFGICLLIVVLIWASTFLFSIPCHNILSQRHDSAIIEKLISTNWFRTILWTSKFLILIKGVSNE